VTLDPAHVLAIIAMGLASYATRLTGLIVAGRFAPTGRLKAAFDAIPAAVLTAVIAPTLLATGPAETIAGAVTILAALRLPLLAVVGVGVAAAVIARAALG
jgi:uncharacterized membrane protein